MGQSSTLPAPPPMGERAMRVLTPCTGPALRLAQHPPPDLSQAAKRRLAWFTHYYAHRENASFTCRYFGISRERFYYWKRRYAPRDLRTLETRSSRPRHVRPRTWTTEQVEAVQAIREEHPRWGKDKLQHLLAKRKVHLSVSMVGRILTALRARRVLSEPPRRRRTRKPRPVRPYAVRKPKDYQPTAPGDLVEVDTLDVRPGAGHVFKHFTARDVVSRWDVLELASGATAATATRMLPALQERLPFPVRGDPGRWGQRVHGRVRSRV